MQGNSQAFRFTPTRVMSSAADVQLHKCAAHCLDANSKSPASLRRVLQ